MKNYCYNSMGIFILKLMIYLPFGYQFSTGDSNQLKSSKF